MTFLSRRKRRCGATIAGIFSVALGSVLLLCGAGLTPTGNVQRADINANGFSLTNAATVEGTNGNFNAVTATNAVTTPAVTSGTNLVLTAATNSNLNLVTSGTGKPQVNGNSPGAAGGMVVSDANNSIPVDPHAQVNLDNQIFVFIGNSIPGGSQLSSPSTQCYPYLFSQMNFMAGHGYAGSGTGYLANGVYDFGSGGAVVPANTVQFGTAGAITPTTQTASWTGATNNVTLSGSNSNIVAGEFVSGTGIPFGTRVSSISGTALVLSPAIGQSTGTTGTQTGVTLSFMGNDFYDIYMKYGHPLRPAVTGCSRFTVSIGNVINDICAGTSLNPTQTVAQLATLVAQIEADGGVAIVDTTADCTLGSEPGGGPNFQQEYQRSLINDLIRSGAAGVPTTQVHNLDLVYTANTAASNGVALTSDGLHPNAAAHVLIANDLNTFMQLDGSQAGFGPHYFGAVIADNGFYMGQVNNGFMVSDNLNLTINSNQYSGAYARASYINTGWGNALSSTGNEVDWMFAPSSQSAGTYNIDMHLPFKVNENGLIGLGGNGSTVSGTMSNNDLYNDASHNWYTKNNLTVAGTLTVNGNAMALTKATGTLSSGSATISNAAITTSSAISACHLGTSATNAGALYVSAMSAGSVTVKSTNASDNDTIVITVQ